MSYLGGASSATDPSGRRSSDTSVSVDSDTSLPLSTGEYEVFLNFRGPDTRRKITDILYRFLDHLRIRTFLDDESLRKGEEIWPNLVEAIKQSKIYVPIFSKDYANSKWCLRELAAIVERQKQEEGCIILPIFYMVNPSDVRHQTGPYKKAFQKRTRSFDEKTVQEWRDALSKVGSLKGWHVESSNEQGSVADLVSSIIWSHLSKSRYVVEPEKLVAIDEHIEAVKERMKLDYASVGVVGIHGIGGIGKTTIAKAVYNRISGGFARCSFVADVRETLQHRDGIISLQKKIISDVMRLNSVEPITSVSDGIRIIQERVSRFRVLIILDDVDEKSKIDEILGNFENFTSGSRFIITSRNIKVLSTLTEDNKLYKVRGMSHAQSLQLFCKHAFKMNSPLPGYETLSSDVVSTTGGLPLTLKVVGSLLYKADKEFWEDKLAQFQQHTLEEEVREVLMISYTSITDEAKQIFLDIACFFIGKVKEMPSYMWADCGFYPKSNIIILKERSLIEIGCNNHLIMHDQLRDLGREIVHRDNIRKPLRSRSRIWSNQQALDLLNGEKGPSQVQAIKVTLVVVKEIASDGFMNLSELRYFEAENTNLIGDFSNLLPKMRWFGFHNPDGHEPINFKMENLTILDLRNSSVADDWGGWSHVQMANKLKVLNLNKCSQLTRLPCFPISGSLEILHLCWFKTRIEDLDIGNLRNLKVLSLSCSTVRKITGGTIGVLKQLRELDVSGFCCENLGEFLADIGELQALEHLIAEDADIVAAQGTGMGIRLPTSLKELIITLSPIANLWELLELETITVYNCDYGLEIPPADTMWWNLSKLKSLDLNQTNITTAISPRPSMLLPSSLTSLMINNCPEMEWLPNLENLENLTELSIYICPQLQEIQGLEGLKSLQVLYIERGESLLNLNGLDSLVALTKLDISFCRSLQRLPSLASLSNLCEFHIRGCPQLAEIQGLGGMESLQVLCIDWMKSLPLLEGLGSLLSFNKLQTLRIWSCRRLTTLLPHDQQLDGGGGASHLVLDSLQQLCICGPPLLLQTSFGQMLHVSKFPGLMALVVEQMYGYDVVENELLPEGLESLEELTTLRLHGLAIQKLPSLSKLQKLVELTVINASNLREIEGVADLKSLQILKVMGCTSFETLPEGLSGYRLRKVDLEGLGTLLSFNKLQTLYIDCPRLTTLSSRDHQQLGGGASQLVLDSLQKLYIRGSALLLQTSFGQMLHLSKFPRLMELEIVQRKGDNDVEKELLLEGLESLEELTKLRLDGLAIQKLPSLSKPQKLKELIVTRASNLREIKGVADFKSLQVLTLCGCTSFETLLRDCPVWRDCDLLTSQDAQT